MKVNDILVEGTWALVPGKIPELIAELEQFKKKAYRIAGDDIMFDGIDSAIARLRQLAKE